MSRLPNAPLIEVVFELKWEIKTKEILNDFQFLHGDLYAQVKSKYPYRETIIPDGIPIEASQGKPVYRFRKGKSEYPLIQIGPGILTVNVIDDIYIWEEFKLEVLNTLKCFLEIYDKVLSLNIIPSLTYVDLIHFDKTNQNSIEFINNNLQFKINPLFTEIFDEETKLHHFSTALNYQLGEELVSLSIADGGIPKLSNGLVLQNKVFGSKSRHTLETLDKWLDRGHSITRKLFLKLTEGKLYEQFSSN